MSSRSASDRRYQAQALMLLGLVVTTALILGSDQSRLLSLETLALLVGAVVINLSSPTWRGFSLTGSFVLFNFAAVAVGPGPAAAVVVMGELATFAFDRIRYTAIGFNMASAAIPAYLVGWICGGPLARSDLSVRTLISLAGASTLAMLANGLFVAGMGWYEGYSARSAYTSLRGHFAIQLLTVPVLVGLVTTYLALGAAAAFLVPVAILGVNHTVGLMISARHHAQRAAVLAASRQRLVAQAMDAEDRERRRLAERLHDEAIQSLLVAQHDLSDDDPEVRTQGAEAVGQAIADLRGAVFDLHPAVLDQAGLVAAVEAVADQQARRGAFEVSVDVDRAAEGIADELTFTLARELLVNAGRHSQASAVHLSIGVDVGRVVLEVSDDGVGFDAGAEDEAVRRGHIGLASSRERVEVLGGRFELHTAPGAGTKVRVVIPPSVGQDVPPLPGGDAERTILAARRPSPERTRATT